MKLFSKIISSLVLTAGMLVTVGFVSCNIGNDSGTASYTGAISGKAVFTNADDNSGIIVTLEKTDGLRSVAVVDSVETGKTVSSDRSVVGTSVVGTDGSYSFTQLADGVYTVYASSKSSSERAVYINVSLTDGRAVTLEDLQLTGTGSISGKVTVDGSESGNIGFTVFIGGTSYMAITGSDGSYTISDVPAGSKYQLIVMKNNFTYVLTTELSVEVNKTAAVADKNFTSAEISSGTVSGKDGADGKDGTSIVWKGSYASAEALVSKCGNAEYLWAFYNTSDGCSYIYDGTEWTILASKGAAGETGAAGAAGADGDSVIWKGSYASSAALAAACGEAQKLWAFFNTTDGCSYIYDGTSWSFLAVKGGDSGTRYLITYVLSGGENAVTNPDSYTESESAVSLADAGRDGFNFYGWYTDSEFSTKVTEIAAGTSGNLTLYAKWGAILYNITYELNGGTNAAENPAKFSAETVLSFAAPTRTGYTFTGWYTDSELKEKTTGIEEGTFGDFTVYAGWTPTVYSIKYRFYFYEKNADSNPDSYTIESAAITLAAPTRTGYTFDGWFTDVDCTQQITEIATGSYGDLILFPKWTIIKYSITYDFGGVVDENVQGNPSQYTVEYPTFSFSNLSCEGYDFKGWYLDSGYTQRIKGITQGKMTGNITLYAKWISHASLGLVKVTGCEVTGSDDNWSWKNTDSDALYWKGVFISGRTITISDFYMVDHEVTQAEFAKYGSSSGSMEDYGTGDNYPVYDVSWYEAVMYCNRRSIAEELTPCYSIDGETDPDKWVEGDTSWNDSIVLKMSASGYRLPTEAEWEFAARGGAATYGTKAWAYEYSGADSNYSTVDAMYNAWYVKGQDVRCYCDPAVDAVGWYLYNDSENGLAVPHYDEGTHEVKQKAANALNLYDMTGNVAEWCWDHATKRSSGIDSDTGITGPAAGADRIIRGGSWRDSAAPACVSFRNLDNDPCVHNGYGFRVVRTY